MAIRLQCSEIRRDQLERVPQALSVEPIDEFEALQAACFDRSFTACNAGEWERLDPIAGELSFLVDNVGRTLLLRAAVEQNDSVVRGLTERSIGITTTDRAGKRILHYLACEAIAENREAVEQWGSLFLSGLD